MSAEIYPENGLPSALAHANERGMIKSAAAAGNGAGNGPSKSVSNGTGAAAGGGKQTSGNGAPADASNGASNGNAPSLANGGNQNGGSSNGSGVSHEPVIVRPELDSAVFARFMSLPLPDNVVQAEYVWLGGSGSDLRSKTRTLTSVPSSVSDLPIWNYDGSSTGQAPGKDSEVYLRPVAMYRDPFRGAPNLLVLCECCLPDAELTPIPSNTRRAADDVMQKAKDAEPWFGVEQEYSLFHGDGKVPLGFPDDGFPRPQGPYYCSVGTENAFGRRVVEAHYRACLYAGIRISGINAEVMPGQWEYQVGPCVGIDSGDQVWMSRYIMHRVCEEFGVRCVFDPKPVPGDWNGAGAHTNYSTAAMRAEGGYAAILDACRALEAKHADHIAVYGEGNERRLTGRHETAAISDFSYGVANRGASIRIPRQAKLDGKGYMEDRRPASNCDPWLVTAKIVQTTVLDQQAKA